MAQTGAVDGTVLDAVTGAPIPGATVKIYSGEKVVRSSTADPQGIFRLNGLADGQYRAAFDSPDHMQLAFDHPAARPFVVSAATPEAHLRAELVPLGQIAGRVLSPNGEPMK